MKFLKGLALSLFGFLLFLCVSTFGSAFMLSETLLNPDFVTTQLNRLDMSSLAEEILAQQPENETSQALLKAIPELEPTLKEQLGAAINAVYDYLLGRSQSLDLALTLRNTVFSTDFIVTIMDKLDISSLAGEALKEQFAQEIPQGMTGFLEKPLEDTLDELEPWLKDQIRVIADPMLDYLFGQSQSFSVEISLEPVTKSLRDHLWQALLESPPPQLAGAPPAIVEEYFEQFYQELTKEIPPTLVIDQSIFGTEMPAQITQTLADAEVMLADGRQYISYFQLGYNALIGFILILILGIVLLHREVKGSSRQLGTTFIACGVSAYVLIFAYKYFIGGQLSQFLTFPSLQTWVPQIINDLFAPLEMFGLACLIGGVVLLIVSFVYPRIRPSLPSP